MAEIVLPAKTGASLNRGKSKQDYGTPGAFLDAVERRFGKLAWDLAATQSNAVRHPDCYFGPDRWQEEKRDSLAQDWGALEGNLWLNPPFADIAPWAKKCSAYRHRVGWILLLVPASVDAAWYSECVHGQAFVMPLNPRLTFAGADDPYPRGLVLAAYGFNVCGFEPWRWK